MGKERGGKNELVRNLNRKINNELFDFIWVFTIFTRLDHVQKLALGPRGVNEEEVSCKMQIQSLWSFGDGKCILVDRGCRPVRGC